MINGNCGRTIITLGAIGIAEIASTRVSKLEGSETDTIIGTAATHYSARSVANDSRRSLQSRDKDFGELGTR